jgi:hypothetical protein
MPASPGPGGRFREEIREHKKWRRSVPEMKMTTQALKGEIRAKPNIVGTK